MPKKGIFVTDISPYVDFVLLIRLFQVHEPLLAWSFSDPKRWFLFYPGWMCAPNLRKVGHGVIKLLIGNKKSTNWWPMCEAICPLLFQGELNKKAIQTRVTSKLEC